jgi:aryl-alcohol dehydrogenase-like predicted oxidoreductase
MAVRKRKPTVVQHIYNLLEPHPGRTIHDAARDSEADTMFLIRVPHSSGMLEGQYTADTVFPPNDHRNHRPRSWLLNGVKKVEQLRFLEKNGQRTLGQAAILWLLADDRVASVLPNIYDGRQLQEFAEATEKPALDAEELAKIDELVTKNFGQEAEEPKYKGTMEIPETASA